MKCCFLSLVLMMALFVQSPADAMAQAPTLPYAILHIYPHDPATSTQGLAYRDGLLIESSGGYGKSFVAVVEPETGKHIEMRPIDPVLFAEGLTLRENELFLLTWRAGRGLVFELETLTPVREFGYWAEGWGLANDGERFIHSDGTDILRFHRPVDFKRLDLVRVRDGDRPISRLNELEYVNGHVLANIWKTDQVAVIDPKSGQVRGWLDLSPLRAQLSPASGVANGIAFDPATGRLYVTGKNWDKLFVIRVDEIP